jgi:hypothetical protein
MANGATKSYVRGSEQQADNAIPIAKIASGRDTPNPLSFAPRRGRFGLERYRSPGGTSATRDVGSWDAPGYAAARSSITDIAVGPMQHEAHARVCMRRLRGSHDLPAIVTLVETSHPFALRQAAGAKTAKMRR